MRITSFLLITLFLTACGASSNSTPPADTTPETPQTETARVIEDYNPDDDERSLANLIVVDNLPAESSISSPLTISGRARGTWFFEGSFPVTLVDENGKLLAESYGSSEESWMTEEFIHFTVTLKYDAPAGTKALLELMLDNPGSPDEGFDRSLIIPVVLE